MTNLTCGVIGFATGVVTVGIVLHLFKPSIRAKIENDVTNKVVSALGSQIPGGAEVIRSLIQVQIAQPVASGVVEIIP